MNKKFIICCGLFLVCFLVSAQNSNQLKYYTRTWEDPDLYGCSEKILIYTDGDSVSAYCFFFCDAIGGTSSYLVGKSSGNTISGIRYIPKYYDDGGFMGLYDYKFKIVIAADKSTIKYYSSLDSDPGVLLPSDAKYTFYGGIEEVRDFPSGSSKVVFQTNVKKDWIRVLKIGKFEKIGESYDFWYEVKIDNKTGWLFGGLNLQ